jgi:Domain of unknown function (DUF1833)
LTISTTAATALHRVSDGQGILTLLTITGGGIAEPVRLVNDTRDLVSNGETFLAVPFEVVMPKEGTKETPRASLRIDNVGREIGQELEALQPGAELIGKIQVVYRLTPDVIEYEFTAPLSGLRANVFSISASMGPTDLMRRPVVNTRFDPFTAPGLFPD